MTNAKIITIYDPIPNYGNRLQNYAVQEILEKLGLSVVTISFQRKIYEGKEGIRWIMKLIAHRLTRYRFTERKGYWKYMLSRVRAFDKFNCEYIPTQRVKYIKDIGDADYFVLGSDQVWNPTWYHQSSLKKDLFLLTFAKPEQKVCLSPSFGIDKLPEKWVPWFQEHLASFPSFSVREETGARLIKELTGKDAIVTIDPTLMLDREDWMKIARKPSKADCSKRYILTYFLGGRSEALNEEMREYAKKIGDAAIYNLTDYAQPDLYVADPSEFIYLVANAQLVLTDSFHASVFSFLFGKPFLCYDRMGTNNSMNSRMETMFGKFHLQRKYANSGLPNDLLECDYREGYSALQSERGILLHYLKTAMGVSATKNQNE